MSFKIVSAVINKLKNTLNSIIITINQNKLFTAPDHELEIAKLEKEQDRIMEQIMAHKNKYLELDTSFEKEINDVIIGSRNVCCSFSCLKT